MAEIENILLNEETLRLVAKNQLLDPDDVVMRATAMAMDRKRVAAPPRVLF